MILSEPEIDRCHGSAATGGQYSGDRDGEKLGRRVDAAREKAHGVWFLRLLRRFVRIPPIIGIAAGVVANLVDLPVTGGLGFFARFFGDTAVAAREEKC